MRTLLFIFSLLFFVPRADAVSVSAHLQHEKTMQVADTDAGQFFLHDAASVVFKNILVDENCFVCEDLENEDTEYVSAKKAKSQAACSSFDLRFAVHYTLFLSHNAQPHSGKTSSCRYILHRALII